jgi:NTP pyrophosphatase (non-canonical NTP hydrolase)
MIELIKKVAKLKDKWGLNNAKRQELKIFEEFGELCKAELEGDIEEIKDGIGDVFITLIIYFAIIEASDTYIADIFKNYHHISQDPRFHLHSSFHYILLKTKVIAKKHNIDIEKCIETEYNKVSQREGKTVNGTFIKNK